MIGCEDSLSINLVGDVPDEYRVDLVINDMILSVGTNIPWIDPMRVGISSGTAEHFYINAIEGAPLGALLGFITEGTTSSLNIDTGLRIFWEYPVNSNAVSLSYGVSSGTGATTGGYIHYFFTRMKWWGVEVAIHE